MALRPTLAMSLVLAGTALAGPMLAPAPTSAVPTVDQRYTISATLDVASGRLDAVEDLSLTNRAARSVGFVDLSVIPRALGYLSLDEPVTVDGTEVETAWTTTTNLRVRLPERLRLGETASIRVPFALDVGASGGAFTARLSHANGVLSFGQWFPILSRGHDTHGIGDSQLSFTADRVRLELATTTALPRDAVACPGLVSAPEANGTAWVCEADDVRDFSFVVNPRFRLTTRDVDGIALRVYTETVSGAATADLAADGLSRLAALYGPYPWPDLVLAEVGSGGGFSMEYPRAIHLTRDKVTDPYVVYHEVAHQWFYAQIGNDQMLEPWLDEAFADFSARELMGIGENQCSTRDVDSPVFAWPAEPTSGGDWTSCDGYFHAVFYRGTEFLTAVRRVMGEERFFGALREYVDANRHGVVTSRDLLDHMAGATSADLLPVYRAYLAVYDGPLGSPLAVRPAIDGRHLGPY